MSDFVSISDAASQLGVAPRLISDGFFAGWLDRSRCPLVGNRRILPREYLDEVRRILAERGQRRRRALSTST